MSSQRDTAISLMQQQKFADALPLFLRLVEVSPEDWSLFYGAIHQKKVDVT